MFNRTFTGEGGGSPGWLFLGKTNQTANGAAVVKVFCMPLPKKLGWPVIPCNPAAILRNMRLLLGIQRIVDE